MNKSDLNFKKVWKALADLVGANTKEELIQMQKAFELFPKDNPEVIISKHCVDILLDTFEDYND